MRYSDIESHLKDGLTALNYSPLPMIKPGLNTIPTLQKQTPNMMIFAELSNGQGLTSEGIFDRPYINIRTIGKQLSYSTAEKLAWDVDKIMYVDGNATVGTVRVLYVARVGGGPQLVDYDSADRYHFQCTYVAEVQSGL